MAAGPLHEPYNFGTYDLATSQVGKMLVFEFDTTISAPCKVVASHRGRVIKTYTEGDGLTKQSPLSVALNLQGADYEKYVGNTVLFECTFFNIGDVEATFCLEIIKTHML